MKRLVLVLAVFGFAACNAGPAFAIKEFSDQWTKTYVDSSDNEGFKAAVKEAKCNVCHQGKDKKTRNPYGVEVGKLLKAKELKPRFATEGDKVKAEIEAAYKKIAEIKGPDGATYGERIKAGKLPVDVK